MLSKRSKHSVVFKAISILLIQAFFVSNMALATQIPATSTLAPPLATKPPGEIVKKQDGTLLEQLVQSWAMRTRFSGAIIASEDRHKIEVMHENDYVALVNYSIEKNEDGENVITIFNHRTAFNSRETGLMSLLQTYLFYTTNADKVIYWNCYDDGKIFPFSLEKRGILTEVHKKFDKKHILRIWGKINRNEVRKKIGGFQAEAYDVITYEDGIRWWKDERYKIEVREAMLPKDKRGGKVLGKSFHEAWAFVDVGMLIGQMLKITEEKKLKHPKTILIPLIKKHIKNRDGWPQIRLEGYDVDNLEEVRNAEGEVVAFELPVRRKGGIPVKMSYSFTKTDDAITEIPIRDKEAKEMLYTVYVKAEPIEESEAIRVPIGNTDQKRISKESIPQTVVDYFRDSYESIQVLADIQNERIDANTRKLFSSEKPFTSIRVLFIKPYIKKDISLSSYICILDAESNHIMGVAGLYEKTRGDSSRLVASRLDIAPAFWGQALMQRGITLLLLKYDSPLTIISSGTKSSSADRMFERFLDDKRLNVKKTPEDSGYFYEMKRRKGYPKRKSPSAPKPTSEEKGKSRPDYCRFIGPANIITFGQLFENLEMLNRTATHKLPTGVIESAKMEAANIIYFGIFGRSRQNIFPPLSLPEGVIKKEEDADEILDRLSLELFYSMGKFKEGEKAMDALHQVTIDLFLELAQKNGWLVPLSSDIGKVSPELQEIVPLYDAITKELERVVDKPSAWFEKENTENGKEAKQLAKTLLRNIIQFRADIINGKANIRKIEIVPGKEEMAKELLIHFLIAGHRSERGITYLNQRINDQGEIVNLDKFARTFVIIEELLSYFLPHAENQALVTLIGRLAIPDIPRIDILGETAKTEDMSLSRLAFSDVIDALHKKAKKKNTNIDAAAYSNRLSAMLSEVSPSGFDDDIALQRRLGFGKAVPHNRTFYETEFRDVLLEVAGFQAKKLLSSRPDLANLRRSYKSGDKPTTESERAQVTELERSIDAVKYEIAKQKETHKEAQTTMVALSKTWIREVLKGHPQSMDINELIIYLRQLCEANDIPFIDKEDDTLLASITERIRQDGIKNPRVIVLAGQDTLEKREYKALKTNKNYFLFGINRENMVVNNYIRLVEMVTLALNITLGKHPNSIHIKIEGEGNFYIFTPPAEEMDWEKLRPIYAAQVSA